MRSVRHKIMIRIFEFSFFMHLDSTTHQKKERKNKIFRFGACDYAVLHDSVNFGQNQIDILVTDFMQLLGFAFNG